MLSLERTQYIMDALKESEVVYVKDLAKKFYLSESTIRRDLISLEKNGLIRRLYGGAMLLDRTISEIPYEVRTSTDIKQKDRIGLLASSIVKDEMVIFMDTSSTVGELVKHIKGKKNVRIITNSAHLAIRASESTDAEIICLGGKMNSYTRGFIGVDAIQAAKSWYADVCFISSRCISLEHGCMDNNDDEVHIKRIMIDQSKHVAFLCDSSKFDKTSVRYLAKLSELDYLITDKRPNDVWRSALDNSHVHLIYDQQNSNG